MKTIYTASKTIHAPMWRKLRAEGYNIIATWIDEAGPGESESLPDLACRCITEPSDADVTVLYCEPHEILKGALVEVGAALASGRQVRVVGTAVNLVSAFVHHPRWKQYESIQAAFADL